MLPNLLSIQKRDRCSSPYWRTVKKHSLGKSTRRGTEIKLSGPEPEISHLQSNHSVQSLYLDAKTHYVPSVVGTGTFRSSGASESHCQPRRDKCSSPLLEKERTISRIIGIQKAIRIRRGALSDFETFDWQPSRCFGTIPVSGEAKATLHCYNGRLYPRIHLVAESVTFNPKRDKCLCLQERELQRLHLLLNLALVLYSESVVYPNPSASPESLVNRVSVRYSSDSFKQCWIW